MLLALSRGSSPSALVRAVAVERTSPKLGWATHASPSTHATRFLTSRRSPPASRIGSSSGAPVRSAPSAAPEFPTLIERHNPEAGALRAWSSFANSTLAIAQLRRTVPDFNVPDFKRTAADLYTSVSTALAEGNRGRLEAMCTASCYATLERSLRSRARGERHSWRGGSVVASVKMVRLGHQKGGGSDQKGGGSNEGKGAEDLPRKYAQVTCQITAELLYDVFDRHGVRVGGAGSEEAPVKVRAREIPPYVAPRFPHMSEINSSFFRAARETPFPPYVAPRFPHMSEINYSFFC